jgi:hypothetical protein
MVGDDYGPIPPWLDNLLILKPDDALIWKNAADARIAPISTSFTPVAETDHGALAAFLRRGCLSVPP